MRAILTLAPHRRILFVACLLALVPCAVGEGSLAEVMAEFWDAPSAEGRSGLVAGILALDPEPGELEELLAGGRTYAEDVETGWLVREVLCADGVTRPYHVLVPPGYTPERRWPLLFNLHGGVSHAGLRDEATMRRYREQRLADDARAGEFLLALPLGEGGAEWWTAVGTSNILGILEDLKAHYDIDENAVFVTGFSDGGSGSYFLAVNHTTPFAGFLPLNGHPGVAQIGGYPVYLPNLRGKPLYVVNTGRDQLYPAAEITPVVGAMRDAGAEVTYRIYEELGHELSYWPEEREPQLAFLASARRVPHPSRLTWETASPETGRCHWLSIDEVADVGDNDEALYVDWNPLHVDNRIRIGIVVDMGFSGTGVRVQSMPDGDTAAHRMGIEPGDILVAMDGAPLPDLDALRSRLSAKAPGDEVSVSLSRGGEEHTASTTFPAATPQPTFVRDQPSARISATVAGNHIHIWARHVAHYTVRISRDLVDVTRPVTVTTNGRQSFQGLVPPDARFMLEQAAADGDRCLIYTGKIEVDLRR